MGAVAVDLPPGVAHGIELSDAQFERICAKNPDWRLGRTAKGDLVIMPPTGGETGRRNFELAFDLGRWNRQQRLGVCFDSSTGFRLPNHAILSPDVSWVRNDRWEALPPEQRRGFLPLCPDFAIELCSPSDTRQSVCDRMQEYIDNGLRLGWLIDPVAKEVEIYRAGRPVETLHSPRTLSGEDVLPGFSLDLSMIPG